MFTADRVSRGRNAQMCHGGEVRHTACFTGGPMRTDRSVGLALLGALTLALASSAAHADDDAKSSPVKSPLRDAVETKTARSPTRSKEVNEASRFGLVAIIEASPPAKPSAQWWLRTDLGPRDPKTAFAKMWNPTIDDAASAGGLRLSSVGLGGGGQVGAAGSRGVATVGDGNADLDVDGFDHGRGALAKEHATHSVSAGADGHVPPDVIQRVVRENFGRLRVCYDIGLRSNPHLAGRVAVKFIIDRAGNVAVASDAGSSLPDSDVVGCVVRAFDTLAFPPSKDSAVTVVYPLDFSPTSSR
jgi:hypothetical protein